MVAVGCAALISWWSSPGSLLTSILIVMTLPYVVGLMVTVVHEGAHGLAAVAMGLGVLGFQIGVGPPLVTIGGDRFHIELRLLPLGGHTALAPEDMNHRGRQLATTIAGPLSGGVLLLLALNWEIPDGNWWSLIRVLLILSTGLSLLINLVPMRSLGNDGWRIAWLLTAPDQEVLSISEIGQRNALAYELETLAGVDRERLLEIRDDLRERLGDVGLSKAQRALLLNNIAVANLKTDDPLYLDEAKDLASEALEILPFQPEIQETLGVALVRLGQDSEGIKLLQRALPELNPEQAADGRAHLALAQIRSGNLYEARSSYLAAQDGGATGLVLDEAMDKIARAELRNLAIQFSGHSTEGMAAKLSETAGTGFAQRLGRRLQAWRDAVGESAVGLAVAESGLEPEAGSSVLDRLIDALIASA